MPRIAKRAWLLAGAVAATALIGTLGYVFIADYSWLDAVYMAIMTMTTVGYGEIRPLGQAGRVFNTFYIVVGGSTMLMVIGVMTQAILEAQLRDVFGRRRG